MKKIKFLVCVLLSTACIVALTGVSLSNAAEDEIKPCQVILVNMENIHLGKESICLAPYFEISNPNDFPVTLNSLNYEISLRDFIVDAKTLPTYYIPAKGKIILTSAFAMEWPHLAMYVSSFKGRELIEGIKEILPLWKGMNGQLFNPKLQEAWDKIPPQTPEFVATGEINITGPQNQELSTEYTSTYKQSSEYKLWK